MKKYAFLYKFILKLIVITLIIYALLTFVFYIEPVSGNNMFPSVRDGDLCIFYRLDDYYLDDVVVYEVNGKARVGRVVAKQGQEVDFPEAGGYTIDGYQPTENIMYQTFKSEESDQEYPMVVPENSCFVMNDFRSDTSDSRENGTISSENIKGKLIFVLRRRGF